MFKPRPMQETMLRYRQGKMGVSAVPGSGKTHTLSYLAARLIAEDFIREDQEVLIVTLVNSAVNNFVSRVEGFITQSGLLPGTGYRVRTLHGLAHDIVRERPDLLGLSNQFQIIDERESSDILQSAVASWLNSHPDFILDHTDPDLEPSKNTRLLRDWHNLVVDVASSFIRMAKDLQATPQSVHEKLSALNISPPLLEMGSEIYADYQRALNYRGAVDFDDLIRLALQALTLDADFLARLRFRWPYILEDEAQDSSRLQEEILRRLAGDDGNWVRVGDPNQAIYETFTTANPRYLINFLHEPGVFAHSLPDSGRSTPSIIRLANYLIDWTRQSHPNEALRDALNLPHIRPAPPGDPQPNPADRPAEIHLFGKKISAERELQLVAKSLQQWLPGHADETVAVLVPRNERGVKLVELLKQSGLEVVELLRSSISTRKTASILVAILRYLADPSNALKLANTYTALSQLEDEQDEKGSLQKIIPDLIRKCPRIEDYLTPRPAADWLETLLSNGLAPEAGYELEELRQKITRWEQATLLPVDQLVLTIAQDLLTNPADLALAHKLALMLENAAQNHPDWRLPEFIEELDSVAKNRRKFLGFSEEDTGFDPDQHKGKVVIATIHKAKGLEWDRVYLLSVNNYDFPSGDEYDTYIAERWFVRGRLNLQAEVLAKVRALLTGDLPGVYLEDGAATLQARLDYAQERLRLLYVGITRARKELVITWNTGKENQNRQAALPARAFVALQTIWEEEQNAAQA